MSELEFRSYWPVENFLDWRSYGVILIAGSTRRDSGSLRLSQQPRRGQEEEQHECAQEVPRSDRLDRRGQHPGQDAAPHPSDPDDGAQHPDEEDRHHPARDGLNIPDPIRPARPSAQRLLPAWGVNPPSTDSGGGAFLFMFYLWGFHPQSNNIQRLPLELFKAYWDLIPVKIFYLHFCPKP